MKIKTCDACGKEGNLWKAKTKTQLGLCKSCAMKNATQIGNYKITTKSSDIKPVEKKKSKKNISPIAEKEKKRLAEYRVVRDEWLGINKRCQFPNCYSRDVQLHHAAGRIGSLLTDTRYFRALCDTHHRWVELHPVEAKKMDLSVDRLNK